ncbi:restriction endonuclease [Pseudomonas denitrificans (nom. rej.)]|nr:restriction endonuclease [Pseudomonas denitrificans (nom. rej.)]
MTHNTSSPVPSNFGWPNLEIYSMSKEWFKFQERIKDHFLSLGAEARTNIRIQGVRTFHDIDVYVQTRYLGEDLVWLIEAKYWKAKVKKNQVLALRAIVEDIGADRGFIVSMAGFQKGAIEAANKTNIKLKTFEELVSDTREFAESEILRAYRERINLLEDRYWSHSKRTRIEYGLRHDVIDTVFNFTGQELLTTARGAIMAAEERDYPIDLQMVLTERKGEAIADSFQQLCNWLNLNLNHLDERLLNAEWRMYENGEYRPNTGRTKTRDSYITELTAKAMMGKLDEK